MWTHGLIPLGILGFRLRWTCALRRIVTSRATDYTSAWLSSWMILGTIVSLALSAFAITLLTFSLYRYFPFTGIDVLIIHGVLDT